MKTAGIICEYDPFHNGHLRQIRLTRQAVGESCVIICCMSGNFVQRGLPARWDKYTRAEAAVRCGADVVLELPLPAVLQSAEGFASCGVEVLADFGVELLSFGAECGDGAALMRLAEQMDAFQTVRRFREGLDQGLSYAAARQRAVEDEAGLLTRPNNILGVEYCRAIRRLGSQLEPLVIERDSDYHSAVPDESPSATAVRAAFPNGPWETMVPPQAAEVLRNAPWYDVSWGERAMLARLRAMTREEWRALDQSGEGLWSKLERAVRKEETLDGILEAAKSKRYPRTRLQRFLLRAYLGIPGGQMEEKPPYVRILAFSDQGRMALRQARKREGLVLLQPGERSPYRAYWDMEVRATDLYGLFASPGYSAAPGGEQRGRAIGPISREKEKE